MHLIYACSAMLVLHIWFLHSPCLPNLHHLLPPKYLWEQGHVGREDPGRTLSILTAAAFHLPSGLFPALSVCITPRKTWHTLELLGLTAVTPAFPCLPF